MGKEKINLCGVFANESDVLDAIEQIESDCIFIKNNRGDTLAKISLYDAKIYEKLTGESASQGVEKIIRDFSSTGNLTDGLQRIQKEVDENIPDAIEYLFSQKLYEIEREETER